MSYHIFKRGKKDDERSRIKGNVHMWQTAHTSGTNHKIGLNCLDNH